MGKPRNIVIAGLLIAVVFIATNIRFPIPFSPTGGLVHLGTVALFVAAVCFGPRKGAAAGAIGMALFNLFSEWAVWAPYTFVIRAVMGFIIGYAAHFGGARGRRPWRNVAALGLGGLWFIPATFVAEAIIIGNWIYPVTSIPGNLIQLILALAVGPTIAIFVQKHILNRGTI